MEKKREITITKEELIAFTENIKSEFEQGNIRAPVHLSCGNEDALIEIFQYIDKNDWVLSTWRNSYHALLHGVPSDELKSEIMKGKSIHNNFIKHNFLSSAIVGGILPIATGIAHGIRMNNKHEQRVWCLIGDMAGTIGIFYDSYRWAVEHHLPITFVIEDNGLATNTPVQKSWGHEVKAGSGDVLFFNYKTGLMAYNNDKIKKTNYGYQYDDYHNGETSLIKDNEVIRINANLWYYRYKRKYPHVGVGSYIVMS